MRICRFNDDRLGLVEGDQVADVSAALKVLPASRWPLPHGDLLVAHLDAVTAEIGRIAAAAPRHKLADVRLHSPVANPGKIIAAPVNYTLHLNEARDDKQIHHGAFVKPIDEAGLFLKATSSLVGPGDGVVIDRPDRRVDHEVELTVIIGRGGRNIAEKDALAHVAGYAVGLDISVRGPEDRSFRKSRDTFTVLGPWLTTADEVPDPGHLDLGLTVNGEKRQGSNTELLIWGVEKLIAYASSTYTLYPGDVLMTGTPEGVSPIVPGDRIDAFVEGLGHLQVEVRGQ